MTNINKDFIRKQVIAARNKLDKEEVLRGSESIAERLNQIECIAHADRIMCYVSFGNEVYTHNIIKAWILEGKQVYVPYVVNVPGRSKYMLAAGIKDFHELSPGSYGILEPPFEEGNIIAPEMIDAIVVPGSAFDMNKNRMGYGAGFYDRFLKNTSGNCSKVGICFDFQIFENIPYEEHDISLDILVTEKRIIK